MLKDMYVSALFSPGQGEERTIIGLYRNERPPDAAAEEWQRLIPRPVCMISVSGPPLVSRMPAEPMFFPEMEESGSRWKAKLSTRQIETFRFFDYDIYTMSQAVIFHIDRPG